MNKKGEKFGNNEGENYSNECSYRTFSNFSTLFWSRYLWFWWTLFFDQIVSAADVKESEWESSSSLYLFIANVNAPLVCTIKV